MRISDEATRGWRVAMGFVRSTTSSSSSRGPHGAALSSQEIMSALAKSADSLAPWDDMVGAWWGWWSTAVWARHVGRGFISVKFFQMSDSLDKALINTT